MIDILIFIQSELNLLTEIINSILFNSQNFYSFMEPLSSEPKQSESNLEITITLIKRFSAEAVIGLVIAVMHWYCYTTYLGYSLPLAKGTMGCVLLSTICGLMTLKWDYKTLETLLENLF